MLNQQAKWLDEALASKRAELKDCETKLCRLAEKEFDREDRGQMVRLAGVVDRVVPR